MFPNGFAKFLVTAVVHWTRLLSRTGGQTRGERVTVDFGLKSMAALGMRTTKTAGRLAALGRGYVVGNSRGELAYLFASRK